MTLKNTREQLIALIANESIKVIALSGRWGTGKSHMWSCIQDDTHSEAVKGALYASLFGLSSVDQIKLKLLVSAAPIAEDNLLWRTARRAWGTAVKALEGYHKSYGALSDLALLASPAILKDRLIVLDDLERKHNRLDIEEVLGFIDEFSQRYGARFLLILNSDRLHRKEIWQSMREKVVDHELILTTSVDEALAIGLAESSSRWSESIKRSLKACGITNIRIIRKIIIAVNAVLGEREELPEPVLRRVVPSTVLLAAIHHHGLDDAPSVPFVLGFGSKGDWTPYFDQAEKESGGEMAAAEAAAERQRKDQESRWRNTLHGLEIYQCDELELTVHEYLQTGLFGPSPLAPVIDKLLEQVAGLEANAAVQAFREKTIWLHQLTDRELLDQANDLMKIVPLLDAPTVSHFCELIQGLGGGGALADAVIERWIEGAQDRVGHVHYGSHLLQRLHPRIQAMVTVEDERRQGAMTPLRACKDIAADRILGQRQVLAINGASALEFERLIRTVATRDLQILMSEMLRFVRSRAAYQDQLEPGMDAFLQACCRIVRDVSSPKLGKLIGALFAEVGVHDELSGAESVDAPSTAP